MATRQLTLEPKILDDSKKNFDKDEAEIYLIASGVVASASLIVSGSIVVLGNAIHWLEYKANC